MFRSYLFAGALALSLASAAVALTTARPFTPRWAKGDTWAVKTEFRQMAHRDGTDPLTWSKPVTFVYTVLDRQEGDGGTTYRIQARPRKEGTGFETSFTMVESAGKLSVTA
jgi:hypothetical protein